MGRLTLEAFSHDYIEYIAGVSMIFGGIVVFALITYLRRWKWLWKEWITTVDHKKIGIMYLIVSAVMMVKGLIDAAMMRGQQAFAVGDNMGYLGAEHFQQIFTAHGVAMIFFVAMGLLFGIINLVVPMQIGARDVAFPFLNSLSFWLFCAGGMYVMLSLIVGVFAGTGWTSYPPLAGLKYNPGVGVDYWLWTLQISGVGTLLSGVNFLVTIVKMRCPGMTFRRMPVFVWASFATMILVIFAFPILMATVSLMTSDRYFGTHFFTSDFGGNPMLYVNLIWAWGHPEVYILILPVFGIFSEFVPVFSQKKLFGYTSMVWAIFVITFLSFIVWLHHFFTMGAGPAVNAFFGIMTMIIAVPTGVKIFNWLFTVFKGRVKMTTPMLWFFGFVIVFTTGGMTGVLMAIPPADFQVHNSLFLIAHFHSVIIGGVVFGLFAGYTYWFPKFFGFKLDERTGKWAFWFWFSGFFLAFLPLYLLGFMGATRRLNHYPAETGWQPLFLTAAVGAILIMIGFGLQCLQLFISIRNRDKNRDTTGDPWNGRTLEWATSSPPPFYNFAVTPEVDAVDGFWEMKKKGWKRPTNYSPIHMPKNTGAGFLIGIFSAIVGFAAVWHMWWLFCAGIAGVLATMIVRFYTKDIDYNVPVDEVRKIEEAHS